MRVLVAVVVVALLAGAGATWWIVSANEQLTTDSLGDTLQTRSRGQLPLFAEKTGTVDVYRFAIEHPEVLSVMPCMCGCGSLGHASNRSCYVKGEAPTFVTFTSHAAT